MFNQTRSQSRRYSRLRSSRSLTLLLLGAWLASSAIPALAADRRFLVILANPTKTYDSTPVLANQAFIDAQYFDVDRTNDVYSMAEWWDEISYGAVTVTGQTIGWIEVPWPLEPADASPDEYINLDFDGLYLYGVSEYYSEDPMPPRETCSDGACDGIPIDYNGNYSLAPLSLGDPLDSYPVAVLIDPENCHCCPLEGGPCEDWQFPSEEGGPNDSCTDGLAEPPVEPEFREVITCGEGTCCLPDTCIDLCTWDTPTESWDCTPTGGEDPPPPPPITPANCIAMGGRPITDDSVTCVQPCNGCSANHFALLGARTRGPNIPHLPLADFVYTPGERFRDHVVSDGRYSALFEPVYDADGDGDCETSLTSGDYLDVDEGGRDNPEAFEDYLIRWDAFAFFGQGDWVPVSKDYIYSNYPLNPDWDVEVEINWFFQNWGYDCDLREPLEGDEPGCVYLKQEMFRLRGLGDFEEEDADGNPDPNSMFILDDDAIATWSNVDEMAWRSGNGVYDPPERFNDIGNTKMQHVPANGDPWTVTTPEPGTYPGSPVDTVPWYQDFWRVRYGTAAPAWAKGGPALSNNSPLMVEFDPANPNPNLEEGQDPFVGAGQRRFFADSGSDDPVPSSDAILPDANGWYFDGWVEHDDLASSKYHAFGDQRFGEVTSPGSDDIWGEDNGGHNPSSAGGPDDTIVAAGPLATNVHGDQRLDGGNVMMLEWMSWRTDIPYLHPATYELAATACPAEFRDCNSNGIPDACDIDCDAPGCGQLPGCGESADQGHPGNGIPDECDLDDGDQDLMYNICELDCFGIYYNSQYPGGRQCSEDQEDPMDPSTFTCGMEVDCNANGVPDVHEIANRDCNSNGDLDDCEDLSAIPEYCQGLTLAECVDASGWSFGHAWDNEASLLDGRFVHPYAGSFFGLGLDYKDENGDPIPDGIGDGYGFRDYNLDGIVDQGEVRPMGSENYIVDHIEGTPNNGSESRYPFNRRRLMEDCMEVIDQGVDFDLFQDVNSLAAWGGGGAYQSGVLEGLVSGIVLFPPNALSDHNLFPFAPSYYPIHNEDRTPNSQTARFGFGGPGTSFDLPSAADSSVPNYYNSTLWVHDLPAGIDRGAVSGGGGSTGGGAGGSGGVRYQIRYAAHEYLHTWEQYPDLYDYARLDGSPAETSPIGEWCIMADGERDSGYPVHPVADLKTRFSGWIEPVELRTRLTPGVEREVTLADAELSNNETYYSFVNPLRLGELFYFWRAGFAGQYDIWMPGGGVLVLHTDVGANPEAQPSQQQINPFTWNIIQADGLYNLDAPGTSPSANSGDAGDPFPGTAGTTEWNHNTFPDAHSRWHNNAFSGIEITDIIETESATRVKFRWLPTEVPSLSFTRPPGGASVDGVYDVGFESYDQFAGTTIEFYYDADNEGYNGTQIPGSTWDKQTAEILEPGSIDWNVSGLPDGRYFLYAKLNPGPGVDGQTEPSVSDVLAARGNIGNGSLSAPAVNLNASKLESWVVTCTNLEGTTWSVVGSISGDDANATTGQPYQTTNGEVSFTITAGTVPFTFGDQFTFVTTGKTAYSSGVTVTDGEVSDGPFARIIADPLAGDPPLIVSFDARSTDPNGATTVEYSWSFGDGTPDSTGEQVTHTYDKPGTYSAVLTATNGDTGAFGTAEVEVKVNNGKPTAHIQWSPVGTDASFPYEVRFFGNGSTDPEDLPLEYLWDFGDEQSSTEMDPDVHTYFEDPDNPGPYCVQVKLLVTDSAGETDLDTTGEFEICPGNAPANVSFTATPASGFIPLTVTFDASATADSDSGQTLSYAWDFDDTHNNTAVGVTAKHTYDKEGSYRVKLTVNDGFSDAVAYRDVLAIKPTDSPIVVITTDPSPATGDVPLTVDFDGSESFDPQDGTSGLSYSWDFGDPNTTADTASTVSGSYTYEQKGVYEATLTIVDKDNKRGTASVLVNALGPNEIPENRAPNASFSVVELEGVAPFTARFESTSSDLDGDALTHEWRFGDSADSTDDAVNTSFTYQQAGTYTVSLTVTDPEGASDTAEATITVKERTNTAPTARIATTPDEVTAPTQVTFNANVSTDKENDTLSFVWEISSEGDPIEMANEMMSGAILQVQFRNTGTECVGADVPCLTPGTYTVEVTANDGAGGQHTSEARSIVVRASSETGRTVLPGAGENAGDGPAANPIPITGSSNGGGGGGGMCGIGLLMPTLLSGLAMALAMARRRRL